MSNLYELYNVEQHYDGKKVLQIENLILEENKITGFFGPNGSGKSTLFSLLSFISKPTLGKIKYNGISAKKMNTKMRQSVIMVPQNPYLLKRTVFENIAYGLRLRNETENLKEKIGEALHIVGLDLSFSKRKWSQLSGGEAQRVALAARLILKPKVLILDEPTTGVDTNSAQLIKEAILTAKQKWNTTILISSHDHKWLNQICDKRVALFQGNLIESGSVNLLFAPWEKNEDKNLVKHFLDGQTLVIKNSNNKKRDSVVMVDSDAIKICKENCENMEYNETLKGTVVTIGQEQSTDKFCVEIAVNGINFNSHVSRDIMKEQRFLPGDRININIDTSEVLWWTL